MFMMGVSSMRDVGLTLAPLEIGTFRERHRELFEFIDHCGTGVRMRFLGRRADSELDPVCYVAAHPDRRLHRKQRAS